VANLTGKQQAFVDHYLACNFNATEAARLAGYKGSDTALSVVGHRNLRKAKIANEIARRLSERVMTAEEALIRLSAQAKADASDFITIDEQGYPKLDFERAKREGKLHLIKKLYQDRNGRWRLELLDSTRALELIGKHHGLFVERHEITGKDGGPIEHTITPDELARAAEETRRWEQERKGGIDG
jgi:phage terminase small subunit